MQRPSAIGRFSIACITLPALLAGCATAPEGDDAPAANKTVADTSVANEAAPQAAPAAGKTAHAGIELCPMQISNPPPTDKSGKAIGGPIVSIKSVPLLLMPATNACLSSGYGPRSGRLHRGVDYHTRTSGDVLAAGDGVIVEAVTRADFGNMIVIDHGSGVYTRYAHLASFAKGAAKGAKVRRGGALGPIGASGATSVKHLHFEILSGTYATGAGSFGLSAHNPFDLPPAKSDVAALVGREPPDA